MQCPKCGGRGRVTCTLKHETAVQRYRRCKMCDHRWKTWEEKDPAKVRARKSSARRQENDLFGVVEKEDAD